MSDTITAKNLPSGDGTARCRPIEIVRDERYCDANITYLDPEKRPPFCGRFSQLVPLGSMDHNSVFEQKDRCAVASTAILRRTGHYAKTA